MEQKEETRDYSHFDAEWYFDHYFATDQAQENMVMDVEALHNLFEKYNIKGKRLLDVGTGPVIHSVLNASSYVDEIFLSDYAPQNCNYLEQWLRGERKTPRKLVDALLKLEQSKLSVEEKENEIREKVKGVLHIDVNAPQPLGSWTDVPQFDVITSSGCIEAAAVTVEDFEKDVVNVTSLLKPGGFIVLLGGTGGSQYLVGNYVFKTLTISKQEVETALQKAGLVIHYYDEISATEEDLKLYKYSTWYYIVATKG